MLDTMHTPTEEKTISLFFRIGVFLKGIHSILDLIGGILLLIVNPAAITQLIVWLTQGELTEDPHDFVANILLRFGNSLSISGNEFVALYLLSHGVIEIILVIALLKNKLWAYPWSLIVLGIFVLYQIYLLVFSFSIGFAALTVFDLGVLWLIWREYEIVKRHAYE